MIRRKCAIFFPNEGVAINERRHAQRIPCTLGLRIGILSRVAVVGEPELYMRGTTEDVGKGGVRFLADRAPALYSVVRCEINVPETEADIPTLMQVRWLQKLAGQETYRVGLQFLL